MSDDALAARLLGIFVDELDEQLRELDAELLALERTPDDAERLRAVFRVMHTLKGAGRAAGLHLIEQVCHVLEQELSNVRDGRAALTGVRIALLFEAADALGEARDELRAGRPLPEAALSALLHHARGREPSPEHGGRPTPVAATPVVQPTPKPTPAPTPETPPADAHVRADDALRGTHVRVSLGQVDAIAAAAGEISGLAAQAGDRSAEVAALRGHWRAARTNEMASELFADFDRQLTRLLKRFTDDARALSTLSGRLGDSARQLRQRPFADITDTLPRVVRDVARELGKQARVVVVGGDIEADRVVLEALREPLVHLVRNAVDHGVETPEVRTASGREPEAEIRVEGALRGDRLRVSVTDDGRGLDLAAVRAGLVRRGIAAPDDPHALARAIFSDGFTTREKATTVSGRGVGLGIVREAAERVGGTVDVTSAPGRGTTISMDVPLSVATMRAVLLQLGDVVLAVPSAFVVRALRVNPGKLARTDGRPMLVTPTGAVPVATLAGVLGAPFVEAPAANIVQVLLLESGTQRIAIVADDLLDERELVLRPVENAGRSASSAIVGTALVSGGRVVPVLSVPAIITLALGGPLASSASLAPREETRVVRVLVVDDSITSRTLEQSVLAAGGYDVITAVDGLEAWRILERQDVALVVSDVEMPHLDGIGLCKRIRETARTAQLPVILVTSLDEPAQRARGLEAGADAYITKSSFDQDTLLETVRMLVGSGRSIPE